jgi:hypothetical protein
MPIKRMDGLAAVFSNSFRMGHTLQTSRYVFGERSSKNRAPSDLMQKSPAEAGLFVSSAHLSRLVLLSGP